MHERSLWRDLGSMDSEGNENPSSPVTTISSRSDQFGQTRACDLCHRVREKCRWPLDGVDACERCSRLQRQCRTDRPLRRPGRKPRLATGDRLSLSKNGHKRALSSGTGISSNRGGNDYADLAAGFPEKDSPSPDALSELDQSDQLVLCRNINLFPELDNLEVRLLGRMLHKQMEVDRFIIGPSFRQRHLQAFVDQLSTEMLLVKDAFIACASLLVESAEIRQLAKVQHLGHKRAAIALASLRHMELHDSAASSTVLMLGMAIVTFASHYSGGELSLCRHLLGLIKPFHDNDSAFIQKLTSDGQSALLCLLATETFICLLQGQVPTINARQGDFDGLVDRFMGVSAPLLTHFYDICEVAQLSHCSRNVLRNTSQPKVLLNKLELIELSLQMWQPATTAFLQRAQFAPQEIALMQAQANVLRLTGLLVVHRLNYPFGSEDAKAMVMSKAILDELLSVFSVTGRSAPAVDFPYFIACLEIVNPRQREMVLANLHLIADFSARTSDVMKRELSSFWAARDSHPSDFIYWDDIWRLISAGKIAHETCR
jgi:hypothetical protein